jgi:hypothetical protein
MNDIAKIVFWHRELPPLEAELVTEHTIEANKSENPNPSVPSAICASHQDRALCSRRGGVLASRSRAHSAAAEIATSSSLAVAGCSRSKPRRCRRWECRAAEA